MQVLQEILSPDGERKAVISLRRDGLYAVETFRRWREESLDFGPQSAWRTVAGPALAAEMEDAVQIAWQQLEGPDDSPFADEDE